MSATDLRPTEDPVPGLIRRIALPAGTGMLFQTLFNVVDTFYAGLISTEALAALAVSFPVFFIVIALVVGIGHGASALIANAIGEGAPAHACRLWGQALLLAVITGGLVAVYGLLRRRTRCSGWSALKVKASSLRGAIWCRSCCSPSSSS